MGFCMPCWSLPSNWSFWVIPSPKVIRRFWHPTPWPVHTVIDFWIVGHRCSASQTHFLVTWSPKIFVLLSMLLTQVYQSSLDIEYGHLCQACLSPLCPFVPIVFPGWAFGYFLKILVCMTIRNNKSSLTSYVSLLLFFKHSCTYAGSIPVYMDESKSDARVSLGAASSFFCRGCHPPSTALVFMAELSAILLALKIIFTLPHSFFSFFSDTQNAPLALQSSDFSHPVILSILQWLYFWR